MNDSNLIYMILGGLAIVGIGSLGGGAILSKIFGNKNKPVSTEGTPKLPKYPEHKEDYKDDKDSIEKSTDDADIDSLLKLIDSTVLSSKSKRKK